MNSNGGLTVTRSKQQQAVKPWKLTLCMCQSFRLTCSLLFLMSGQQSYCDKYWEIGGNRHIWWVIRDCCRPVIIFTVEVLAKINWTWLENFISCKVSGLVCCDKKSISLRFLLNSPVHVLVLFLCFCAVKLLT